MAELDSGAIPPVASSGVTRTAASSQTDPRRGTKAGGRFDSFAFGDEKIAHVNIQVVNIMRGEAVIETGSLTPYT